MATEIDTGIITSLIQVTYNGYPVRGYLYYPTSINLGSSLDVVVLYHGTITSPGVSPSTAASTFINIALNKIKITDKLIFSVAYPQDIIPAWQANPSLPATQFPGLNYSTLYFGDNIVYAEAALLWVKNNLNSYMSSNDIPKTTNKVFTFGHSQGAYLVHRLNTMLSVNGAISNAPGPIDLLDRCKGTENTSNLTCNKIRVGFGSTSTNPAEYNSRSLKIYTTGTLSPAFFSQAIDDDSYQVNLMQNVLQPGLSTCTNCATKSFKYYPYGGHDAFVSNTELQQDIRNFIGSTVESVVETESEVGISSETQGLLDLYNQKLSLDTEQLSQINTVQSGYTITTGIEETDYIKIWGPTDVIANYNPSIQTLDNKIIEINDQINTLQNQILSVGQAANAVGCGTTGIFLFTSIGFSTVTVVSDQLNYRGYTFTAPNPFSAISGTLINSNSGIGTEDYITQTELGVYYGPIGTAGLCSGYATSITNLTNSIVGLQTKRSCYIQKVNILKSGRSEYQLQNYAYEESKSQLNTSIANNQFMINFLKDPNMLQC
jgi:hypothetical protein